MSKQVNTVGNPPLEANSCSIPSPGRKCLLAAVIAVSLPGAAAANVAGRIEFAHGNAMLVYADGNRESLDKGMTVSASDTIKTGGRGIAQLRLTDGSYISIAKNSTFRIDEYSYQPTQSGDTTSPRQANKGFFSLLAGGFRTITGFLGTDNYRVKTPLATIGIRGTEYYAELGTSLNFNVSDGAIEVCNTGGCQFFRENEFGEIADSAALITRLRDTGVEVVVSDEKDQTVAAVEGSDNFEFKVADEVDDEGEQLVVQEAELTPQPRTPDCTSGNCTAAFGFTSDGSGVKVIAGISGSFDDATLVAHGGDDNFAPDAIGTTTAVSAGLTPDIGWGRWTNGSSIAGNTELHYVIGESAPDINTLSGTMHYSVKGWTRPTHGGSDSSFVSALGAFNGIRGDLNVNFTNPSVSLDFIADFDNADYQIQENISIADDGTFGTNSASVSGGIPIGYENSSCDSGYSCSAILSGFISGDDASNAGLGYFIEDTDGGGSIIGAAAYEADGPGLPGDVDSIDF